MLKKSKQLVITIDENGKVEIEAKGYIGDECLKDKDLNAIKDALGIELSRNLKPTYWQKGKEKSIKYRNLCG